MVLITREWTSDEKWPLGFHQNPHSSKFYNFYLRILRIQLIDGGIIKMIRYCTDGEAWDQEGLTGIKMKPITLMHIKYIDYGKNNNSSICIGKL